MGERLIHLLLGARIILADKKQRYKLPPDHKVPGTVVWPVSQVRNCNPDL